MKKQWFFSRVVALASLLFGAWISEAATIRAFNAVSAASNDNVARLWVKLLNDPGDPVDLGYVGPGQYVEWTDPLAPPLSGTVTFHYTYDPAEQFWWNAQGFTTMNAADWVTASLGGQVTPYVYIAPSNKDLAWFGRVRLWNRTAAVQTVTMNPQVTLTIPAGENVEWELELNSLKTAGTPFWSQYLTVFPSDTLNTNMMWLFWTLQDHSGYTQMHIQEGGAWAYCLTHAVPFDDNGVDMTPVEWGPCADTGTVPPEPGAGGGGGGGGGEGEGNGTGEGGGGEGGGGETVIIDLTELIGLATIRNNLLNLALACCEEGHVVAKNVSGTNSMHLLEIINLLQPAEVNATDPAVVEAAEVAGKFKINEDAGGMLGVPALGMLFNLGNNPIVEPAAGAFVIPFQPAQGPNMDISLDYRDITHASTIALWSNSIIASLMVGFWIWAVYKHYEEVSAQLWSTPQATTSGESVIGTNINLLTAATNAAAVVAIIATLWVGAVVMMQTIPCITAITGAFGDFNAPAGGGGDMLGVIVWTTSEFIPISCALTLIGTYVFFRATTMVQVSLMKTGIKFAVA